MKQPNRFYILYALMAILYLGLIIFAPQDAAVLTKYHLSSIQAKELSLTMALPLLVIWWFAFYGFIRLKAYAQLIERTNDGKHVANLAKGVFWLAISLPINSVMGSYLSYLAYRYPSAISATVITANYLRLTLAIIAFYWIYKGTQGLAATLVQKTEGMHRDGIRTAFIALGLAFTYITLNNPYRRLPTGTPSRAVYYLPDILILLTIIIPYLWVWYRGFASAHYLHLYKQKVKGVLYKSGLGYIANGLACIIASSIVIQFLVSITTIWNGATLHFILFTLYVLIIFTGLGYFLVAVGANRLKKIEEV